MALTYHFHHNVISCACGKLITGKHTCDIQVTKVVVGDYDSGFSKHKNRVRFVLLRSKSKDTMNNGKVMILVVLPVLNAGIDVITVFQNVVAVQLL